MLAILALKTQTNGQHKMEDGKITRQGKAITKQDNSKTRNRNLSLETQGKKKNHETRQANTRYSM
jgi:hypothetical protein